MPDFKSIYWFIGLIAFLIGLIIGFHKYVNYLIDKKLNDEKVINRIARNLRPYLIFNEAGTVILDEGGWNYMKSIDVEPGVSGEEPRKITISPKEPLRRDPIIQCLNDTPVFMLKKTEPFDYVYELSYQAAIVTEASAKITSWQFKIEILK